MTQTALDWLVEELGAYLPLSIKEVQLIINQAKEMEKQQIINANTVGVNQGLYGYKNAEQYYNKTFKK